jgi:hypothetical protein
VFVNGSFRPPKVSRPCHALQKARRQRRIAEPCGAASQGPQRPLRAWRPNDLAAPKAAVLPAVPKHVIASMPNSKPPVTSARLRPSWIVDAQRLRFCFCLDRGCVPNASLFGSEQAGDAQDRSGQPRTAGCVNDCSMAPLFMTPSGTQQEIAAEQKHRGKHSEEPRCINVVRGRMKKPIHGPYSECDA